MNDLASNLKSVFGQAIEIGSPDERAAYLDQECGANQVLRAEVEGLIQALDKAGEFMQMPAAAGAVGTIAHQPALERPGTQIGPYKLLEQIGEGGFGVVFMAEQLKPIQRKVAVKIIKPGMDTRQVIARFEAERQALALMDHPNIAKVLDAGTTASGRPYFVMELVRGVPVTEFCDQKTASVRDRLELFITICQAVQHAHQKGIIHRDIKPTNVLVTLHDGRPVIKVIDFGVAKATGQKLTDKTLFTGFAQMVGTPLYMSPEQAEMSGLDVDTRSDIYSLGVLLYELLTGMTPFDKDRLKTASFDELRRIIREEEPPRPSTRLTTIDAEAASTVGTLRKSDPRQLSRLFRGELDWIVMKCLEKDRTRRYETASALATDVERYLHNEPVQACPPTARYRFGKFARRNKWAFIGGALFATTLLIIVGVVAGSVGWVTRDRAAREGALEQQIGEALKESQTSYEAGKLTEARSALRRAEGLLASSDQSGETKRRVERWRVDLDTVERLEQIRMDEATAPESQSSGGLWDYRAADQAYQAEFERYGLKLNELDVGKTAQLIRGSAIKPSLVAALDDWFSVSQRNDHADKKTRSGRRELLQIARTVDPDPWRDRLRDAIERGDDATLTKLAAEDDSVAQPVPTVLLLVRALEARNPNSVSLEGASILSQVQQRHPNDFWVNFELANCLPNEAAGDEIGYRRIAVALRPDSPGALIALATSLHEIHNDVEARAVYGEAELGCRIAVHLKPNDTAAHLQLFRVLHAIGKDVEAEAVIRNAIRLDPGSWNAQFDLAQFLRAKNTTEGNAEAIAPYREAIRLKPDEYSPHIDLGWALSWIGHDSEAVAEWREAIRIDPSVVNGPRCLGFGLFSQGKFAEAEAAYREALRLDPNCAGAIFGLRETELAQTTYEKLDISARKGIRLNPNDFPYDLARAFMRRAEGGADNSLWDDAATAAAGAIELWGDSVPTSSMRKTLCRALVQRDELFQRLTKLRPDEPALWLAHAQNLALQGRWAEGAMEYAKVAQMQHVAWEPHEYAGLLLLLNDTGGYRKFCRRLARDSGQLIDVSMASYLARAFAIGTNDALTQDRIVHLAEQGRKSQGDDAWRLLVLGLARYRAGDYAAAIQDLQRSNAITKPLPFPLPARWGEELERAYALSRVPVQAQCWLVLAMAHCRLGHTDEAQQCIETARNLIEQVSPHGRDEAAKMLSSDWIPLQVLSREAEALLSSAPLAESKSKN